MQSKNNKKVFGKFMFMLIVCTLLGGVLGFATSFIDEQVISLASLVHTLSTFITTHVLSINIAISTLLLCIYGIVMLRIKKMGDLTNLETDELEDKADLLINTSVLMNTLNMVLFFLCFSISITAMVQSQQPQTIWPALILFIAGLIVTTALETYSIKRVNELHPQRTASNFSSKFEKEWVEQSDEAERMMTYVIGHKVCMFMKKVFIFTLTALILIGLFIPIGILPYFLICFVWVLFLISYSYYGTKVQQGKIKY